MTAQDLKNSILQLAVQGKLVPQDPNDEPASELLKRIQAEKAKLIKDGKIKKEKPLPAIADEEKPFDIPDSWKWVRLGQCGTLVRGSGIKKDEVASAGLPCVRYGQLYTHYKTKFSSVVSFISKELYQKCQKSYPSDILMALTGENNFDIALAVTYSGTEPIAIGGDMTKYTGYYIDPLYFTYALNSPYGIMCKSRLATGNIIVHISNDKLASIPIPLPPLAEQERIVAKIEELMPLVEEYGKTQAQIKALNAEFPDKLRKSILQQAVQGKLTERDPSDEPASELLKRIRAEKTKLIAEGKIKKEKPLPPITDEENPFDIPDTWEWVRLSDVIDVRDGTHDTPKYITSGYPLITGKDFYNGYFQLDKTQYISEADYLEIIKRSKVDIGDILFSMIGGNIGSMIRITTDNYFEMGIKNVALFKQYMENETLSCYLFYFLKSQIERMRKSAKGGAQPFVPLNLLRSYPFPLPPLEEQKRIVARVEELLAVCDGLK